MDRYEYSREQSRSMLDQYRTSGMADQVLHEALVYLSSDRPEPDAPSAELERVRAAFASGDGNSFIEALRAYEETLDESEAIKKEID